MAVAALEYAVSPVHGISVRDGDLAIATHGRAFWILDDVEPLRELVVNASSGARLFSPRDAVRTRDPNDEAEASPPETPLGENPPNGAFIDYIVPPAATGTVRSRSRAPTDASRAATRRTTCPSRRSERRRVSAVLDPGTAATFHRARDAPVRLGLPRPRKRRRARAAGHLYRAADGRRSSFERKLVLKRDPRVHATDADLVAQANLAVDIDALLRRMYKVTSAADDLRAKPGADVAAINRIAGDPKERYGGTFGDMPEHDNTLRAQALLLENLVAQVESADAAPSIAEQHAWTTLRTHATRSLVDWSVRVCARTSIANERNMGLRSPLVILSEAS